MTYERLWERLLEYLNTWGTAVETAPGRIQMSYEVDGVARRVEIVMRPDEWEDFASSIWGNFDAAAHDVHRMIVEAPADMPFRVYGTYELVPSATSELPIDPDDLEMDELARQHPEGFGRWVVTDGAGNVLDELGPEPD
ncbi:hypothetical protein KV102_07615 [Mumia sp. zg.B53]|uniref:hypothetical protein n=1 Tax=unclassified Mumia TaxID=2621872 RepID=UPI001C6DEBBD|nr:MULTISPECIES: hypothetical protein [unclassified Mumia]MBW9210104.1 hypothetical protein [Mumia sp. zg.B21]MBW9214710.1 hypothetical protein [Mumia sp. zg.B53]